MTDIDFLGEDLRNRQFGQWTVLDFVGRENGNVMWLCRCACGVERKVAGVNLGKRSNSCGHKQMKTSKILSVVRAALSSLDSGDLEAVRSQLNSIVNPT